MKNVYAQYLLTLIQTSLVGAGLWALLATVRRILAP